uniref:Protein kinase domain-containing protein n=1 Tax=Physcomitrium patens TaxID=3218 RepID=A0A7I4A4X1_PHYPA
MVQSKYATLVAAGHLREIMTNCGDPLELQSSQPPNVAQVCLTGSYYRGRQADVWALGCTLYCMVMGRYPFMGDTLPSIYEKIVNQPLLVPEATNPELADLLRGLLCKGEMGFGGLWNGRDRISVWKDARKRFSLAVAAAHPWSTRGYAQVQASCNPTVYEVQHPFPAGGAALAVGGNGSVELGSVV